MYKHIKFKLLITCISLILVSCSKDEGNYVYEDINEVVFVGFQEEYTAMLGESFSIEPSLQFTQDSSAAEDRYEYEWFVGSSSSQLGSSSQLATTRNLMLDAVTLEPGDYTLVYEIKDMETGVTWQKKVRLNVVSTIYEGWMVLNEVNGGSRLDMISLLDGAYTPIHDVLQYVGSSLELEGQPVWVLNYNYNYNFYGVYVTTTGNGTTKIDPETFDWEDTYRLSYEALANFPTDFGADQIVPIGPGSSYMQKDGDVYYYLSLFGTRYGVPINTLNGQSFSTAPFIAPDDYGYSVFYDETNKRFLRHGFDDSSMSEMPEGTLFDYETGMDLVYMTKTTYNGGEVFAILNDPGNSDLYLARITSTPSLLSQTYYEKIPDAIAIDMAQADHFAVNPDFGYLFYSLNGKVYEYDFSLKTSKLMIENPGQEITLLAFDQNSPSSNSDPTAENFRTKLIVASYDPSAAEGKFELYNVPPVNGDLQLFEAFGGFGRIVSESYRPR